MVEQEEKGRRGDERQKEEKEKERKFAFTSKLL